MAAGRHYISGWHDRDLCGDGVWRRLLMNKGTLGFPGRWWESPTLAITATAQAFIFNHGMGELPFLVEPVLVCLKNELGYAAGQEVTYAVYGNTGDTRSISVLRDRSRIVLNAWGQTGNFAVL